MAEERHDQPGWFRDGAYLFLLAGDDGGPSPTRGVTGIVPTAVGRNLFVKRTVNAIPMVEGNDHIPGHDTWVSMPTGVALGSQGALSILEGYATIEPCPGESGGE